MWGCPPLLVRLTHLLTEEQIQQVSEHYVEDAWNSYVNSLPEERRRLMGRFKMTDGALRVGGVGIGVN